MSLDVYLSSDSTCPHCSKETGIAGTEIYWANITHNLGKMAEAAGIYKHLWRPEEIEVTRAGQLIEPLREGLKLMKANPAEYEKHNAPNGWGTYQNFVSWIEKYLAACESNPGASVSVSR